MRIRPDGIELLRAARTAIDTAILPHLTDDRHDALRAIERAVALGEDRLARDANASAADLAVLEHARASMRDDVLEALPVESRYDARLVAKAIAVATRQLANGDVPERRECERLIALLDAPNATAASRGEIRCTLTSLNERLGTRIRAGAADEGTAAYAQTLAHLEATTREALSESSPTYRRLSASVASKTGAAPCAAQPTPPVDAAPVDAALTAWRDVPRAFVRAFPIDLRPAPIPQRIDALLHLSGAVGEAVYTSGNAAIAAQADVFGWFAQRLAANPNVPMVAVESAHQVHDVFVAIADASATCLKLALEAFRRVDPLRAEATKP